MLKKNDAVKINDTSLEGVVVNAAIGDQANVLYLVEFTDKDGQVQQRYFEVDQIASV